MKSTQNLYYIIKGHPITSAHSIVNGGLVDPQNLYDYRHNLMVMKEASVNLKSVLDKISGGVKIDGISQDSYFDKYKQSRYDFASLVDSLIEFVGQAIHLSEQSESKRGKLYLKNASKTLANMSSVLKTATKHVAHLDRYDESYMDLFEETQAFFDSSVAVIIDFYEEYKNTEKKRKELETAKSKTVDESRIVKNAPNQKELERVDAIKKANDLYDRFCVDFMRDLEKEVSLMNRDMYEELIDKFERFLKRFPMPLASNTSIGMANEAYSQIDRMINMVYEISKNTYSPVVFGK